MNKYIAYMKNNPRGYWFKRKLYGWGWVPVRWQGWAVIAVSAVLLILNGVAMTVFVEGENPTPEQLFWFFANLILIVVVLISICYWKGEKPRWQWGIPNEERENK